MPTVKEAIQELTNPLRRNDLEARRLKLGLTRVALGRILDVDQATVFRRERGPMIALWDYAMRGIEAEAASEEAKQDIRWYTARLKDEHIFSEMWDERGRSYVAEKMRAARREETRKKPATTRPDKGPSRPGTTSEAEAIKRRADKYFPGPDRKK